MPENSPEFLIEGILPANEVHLLGGSSGSGKTTFMFQILLAEWQEGKPIFDHLSHPVPYAYVSLDRSRSSVVRTLERLGLSKTITRLVCQEDLPEDAMSVEAVVKGAIKVYHDAKLIVIEGFQLLAGDGTGRYTSVARTLKKAARLCSQHGLTIIGICHSPKMKIDESFQHPREMLLGSVSWGAYSDTVITLNLDEMTGIIHVHVMPRNAASEKHELRFGQNGVLEAVVYRGKKDVICTRIGALVEGRPITRTEIVQWGEHLHIGSRTCDSAIKICLENGVLEAIGAGIYERTTLSPPELPADSDYTIEE